MFVRAQATEEETRKQQFLKARASKSTSPTPSPSASKKKKSTSKSTPSPTPKEKAKSSKKSKPDESPTSKSKKKKAAESDDSTPKPKKSVSSKEKKSTSSTRSKAAKKKSTARKEPASKKKKTSQSSSGRGKKRSQTAKTSKTEEKSSSSSAATPEDRPTAPLPRAIPVPTVAPIEREPAQLTIEKSGYEKPPGFFSRLFGGGGRRSGASYRYLTRSVRAEIDRAPVLPRRWQYIVVHNSGTRQGNAAAFDYYHRHVRRMQNGLAYHFVIGNGTSTGNGQIEIGNRWRRQINGGHVHSDYLNNIALGICLVGDFNRDQPTRAQLECCEELIRYLRLRCGKIGNHYAIVRPHREMNPPRWATDCPGDDFPYSWFRRFQD